MTPKRKVQRAARKLFRLCVVDGSLDEGRVRQALQRIAASSRRGTLSLLSAFQRLVRLDRDQHAALIESAAPLADDVRARILADLARLYGPRLRASFADNPALIGGLRVSVGSDVYDGSIRARLATLQTRL